MLAALVLTTSCAGGVTVYSYFRHTSGPIDSELAYAGTRGPVPTRIHGNPFAVSKARLDRWVTDALGDSPVGTVAAFSTAKAGPGSPYRMVLSFDGPHDLDGEDLCRGAVPATRNATAGAVRLAAAFCLGDGALSEATGEAYGVSGLDDPDMQMLVNQIMFVLFPGEEEDDDDDQDEPPIP